MFDPGDRPRVFGLPPGVDFPSALVAGLTDRLKGHPPHATAQVELIVNTRRMARRIRQIYDAGPGTLLPRIRLITELDALTPQLPLPPAIHPLRRQLELTGLVGGLLEAQPDLAPRSSLFGLAESLAALMDEMHGEGVAPETISGLDVTDQSGHWARSQQFFTIAQAYLDRTDAAPDAETRRRATVQRIIDYWLAHPPRHPVIVAGSTGSRGTTSLLMQAVARLPQGALILPGFDYDMPKGIWAALDDPLLSEDHPQFRFIKLAQQLGLSRDDIPLWSEIDPPAPDRNRLVSLSLRPAPVTDAWQTEGPRLEKLEAATCDMTLVQAPTPRAEALAIALRLRRAAEDGQTAALITPDRMLARRVTSALDRWRLLPDDSAGLPLHLSPAGRFLRHVADLFVDRLDAEALLTLLKHPLTHSAGERNIHQLQTQKLELKIRRHGLPYPDADGLTKLIDDAAADWRDWMIRTITARQTDDMRPLADWVEMHRTLAETIATGTQSAQRSALWQHKSGETARGVLQTLADQADAGGAMTAADYAQLVARLLAAEEIRDRDAPYSGIMIWGTLEARVQGADLVILGGMNDGTWPEMTPHDPWLNRKMRAEAGMLLPERRVGLSAHDYQQAVAAPEVWITRAIRSDDAETVPSRWLNRLTNLMRGLPRQGGPAALDAMIARGDDWLEQARALETAPSIPAAPRPSPRPSSRLKRLSVTEVKTLIRDPYAVYARHILRLRPLDPLVQSPDAPLRGIIIHEVMEKFVKATRAAPDALTRETLMQIADEVLMADAPWPAARAIWRAKIARFADWFITREVLRQTSAEPAAFEARGELPLADLAITLTGYADRIDRDASGRYLIYDYKTGTPPTASQQKHFDKQLLLEAAMAEDGAFEHLPPAPVLEAAFIGLGAKPVEVSAPLSEEPPRAVMQNFRALIRYFQDPANGFTARLRLERDADVGNYDHLARFGEWDVTDPAAPEDLT